MTAVPSYHSTCKFSYIIIVFYSDISSLAKAAAAGDEAALDMLSWRKSNKSTSNTSSDYSFFFGVVDGKFILKKSYLNFRKLLFSLHLECESCSGNFKLHCLWLKLLFGT